MTMTDRTQISFTLNGEAVSVRADHPHLLAALREELDVTSAKDGCSPSGQCGCCTVLVGGKAMVSCVTSLEKAEGKEITTLEGFDPAERDRLASAFAACGALQCGFCTPGSSCAPRLCSTRRAPISPAAMPRGRLGAHLCRCTGYTKIFRRHRHARLRRDSSSRASHWNRRGRGQVRGSGAGVGRSRVHR